MNTDDRRAHVRIPFEAEAKIIAPGWSRYARAVWRDVSAGGASVELRDKPGRHPMPGDRVRLALGAGVVRGESLIGATVVRLGQDGREVGVRFDDA